MANKKSWVKKLKESKGLLAPENGLAQKIGSDFLMP